MLTCFWLFSGVFARQRVDWPSATRCITSLAKPWAQEASWASFSFVLPLPCSLSTESAACTALDLLLRAMFGLSCLSRSAGSLFSQTVGELLRRRSARDPGCVEIMSMSALTRHSRARSRRMKASQQSSAQMWQTLAYAMPCGASPSGRLVRGIASR